MLVTQQQPVPRTELLIGRIIIAGAHHNQKKISCCVIVLSYFILTFGHSLIPSRIRPRETADFISSSYYRRLVLSWCLLWQTYGTSGWILLRQSRLQASSPIIIRYHDLVVWSYNVPLRRQGVTQEADAFFACCTPVRSPASLRQIEHAAIQQCN